MATHSRHIRTKFNSGRTQIRFERIDLLWRGHAIDPATGEIVRCPLPKKIRDPKTGVVVRVDPSFLLGPTVLDMLVRKIVAWDDLAHAVRADLVWPTPPTHLAIWHVRDVATLWPPPGHPQVRRTVREIEDANAEAPELDHPFLSSLASGGNVVPDPRYDGWVTVTKPSSVNISEGSFRLAVGMHGSIGRAYRAIADEAEDLWRQDLLRCLEIWSRVQQAPLGILIEDLAVEELRPISSVSQELERSILRKACVYLGVDPDLDLSRPPGRPSRPEHEGDVLLMSIEDGKVRGEFVRAFHGLPIGTLLSSLTTVQMVELLGALRTAGHDTDAEYLEAYLDAAVPDWRDEAAEAAFGGAGSPSAVEDPYDTLGVTSATSDQDVAAAFRSLMQAAGHLPNPAPQRRYTAAFKAIKATRKAAAAVQGAQS